MAKKTPKSDVITLASFLNRPGFKYEYKRMIIAEGKYLAIKYDVARFSLLTQHQIDEMEECKRLRDAFTEELCANASDNVTSKQTHVAASSKGGQKAAKTKADELQPRDERIKKAACNLLDNGNDRRNIAAILALRFSLSARQIRNIINPPVSKKKR